MENHHDRLDQLNRKLEVLLKKQERFQQDVQQLKSEIYALRNPSGLTSHEGSTKPSVTPQAIPSAKKEEVEPLSLTAQKDDLSWPPKPVSKPFFSPQFKKNFEKFVGENLINKIGIIITVLGVGIGVKYAIDNEMISPLTRVILGYLVSFGLLGFAIRLKEKYRNFSAVLLSGAIAMMYIITYVAYEYYFLFPQIVTFGLMVLFTAFTVVAAIHYNNQVIAHIGLVGAYFVPFLLSEGEGKVEVLYTYMLLINAGILVIAFKKYWKPLNYAAFGITWLIYIVWYISAYTEAVHFGFALGFLFVFFLLFYLTFLAYKILRKDKFELGDVLLLLINAFIFYGIGYVLLEEHKIGHQLLGLFTLFNALIHFGVCVLIYRKKLADKNLFYLLAGLVLVFITIAVPVQLDGNWVTLLWTGQAVLLFAIGRRKSVPIYEVLAYPLMLLAFFSLLQDWDVYQYQNTTLAETNTPPILNVHFLTSFLFVLGFAAIQYVQLKYSYTSKWKFRERVLPISYYVIPGILLLAAYLSLRLELAFYWDQLYLNSELKSLGSVEREHNALIYNADLLKFKNIWLSIYSMLFLVILSWANIAKIRNRTLSLATIGLSLWAIVSFLASTLYDLSLLRESYLSQSLSAYYSRGIFHILIRYISYISFALLLFSVAKLSVFSFKEGKTKVLDCLVGFCVLWVLSSELIHWMDIGGFSGSYKLGLSILWGTFALAVIGFGIRTKKKHLRLGAIGLFGITLLKVFFYDISHLDTIAKTIVFVSLGILLLIISFLYNKYKLLIADD